MIKTLMKTHLVLLINSNWLKKTELFNTEKVKFKIYKEAIICMKVWINAILIVFIADDNSDKLKELTGVL